jgi:hypothetical protein
MKGDKRIWWMALAVGLLGLRAVLPVSWVEMAFSRGWFVVLRAGWDALFGWVPFPLLFLLVPLLLGWIGFAFFLFREKNNQPWSWGMFREILLGMGGFLGMGLSLFLLLWGFHYGRVPLEDQLQLRSLPLDSAALVDEALWHTQRVDSLRRSLGAMDTLVPSPALEGDELEAHVREALGHTFRQLGFPVPGRARCRVLPQGTLLRLGIAGIYMPFSGEGHVDGGLHPLEIPYTMAHEMSHALGIAGEDDCNLLAALACARSDDPVIRYGGALAHWRLVMGELFVVAPEAFWDIREKLSPEIRRDWRTLREYARRYPDWFPEWSAQVNHVYLRAQGVKQGIKSYDKAVGLYRAYRLKNHGD